jgi:hypothetical protein
MRRGIRTVLALGAGLIAGSVLGAIEARAADAPVGAGGLVFTLPRDVEIASHDLALWETEVIADYSLTNRSSGKARVPVVFALPDLAYEADRDLRLPAPGSANFIGFEVSVDGGSVQGTLEQRASVDGADQSSVLKSLGVPLNPFDAGRVLAGLSTARRTTLQGAGLIDARGRPAWILKSAFRWTQELAPGKATAFRLRYKPIAGGADTTSISEMRKNPHSREYYKRFCIDDAMVGRIERSIRAGAKTAPYREVALTYQLKPLSVPVGRFRLTVDAGDGANLVSFCGQGIRKIDASRHEVIATDFLPERDLDVLILWPREDEAGTSPLAETGPIEIDDVEAASCDELWYARNAIFKAAGYCFKTPRGIRTFGNEDCEYDEPERVPLSAEDRARVTLYDKVERRRGCQR